MITSSFAYKFILIFFSVATSVASASATCPWENLKGGDFFKIDIDLNDVKNVSSIQVQEDLACLRILLLNVYAYTDMGQHHQIIRRLDQFSASTKAQSSRELIDSIFRFHEGFLDTHMNYRGAGTVKQFPGNKAPAVNLSENLEEEKIYDRQNYVYFRPGQLRSTLTKEQTAFVQIVKNNDKPYVIDLRNNPGGDSELAHQLAQVIFTPDQKIPKTERHQLYSPLMSIGYCLTLHLIYGDDIGEDGKAFCDKERKVVTDLNFLNLIPFKYQSETEAIQGTRSESFKSKIILISDSGCASSCETFIEKLSAHPNVEVIGQATYGALGFSNAATFALPHSGILVSLPTLRHNYGKSTPEGIGYKPDIEMTKIDLNSLQF